MYLRNIATFKKILVLVLFAAFASFAHAETPAADSTSADSAAIDTAQMLSPFDHLGHNMLLSAFGWPLGFHMLGGALTYKFSMENNDLMVARFAARQDQLVYGIAFTLGMMMGTFFPILVPSYMYFISDNRALNNTGAPCRLPPWRSSTTTSSRRFRLASTPTRNSTAASVPAISSGGSSDAESFTAGPRGIP